MVLHHHSASAHFEKSLNQLNKLDKKAFQRTCSTGRRNWLEDFPQMMPADDKEGVDSAEVG